MFIKHAEQVITYISQFKQIYRITWTVPAMWGLEYNLEKIRKKMIPIRRNTIIAFCISVIVLILTYTVSQWFIVQFEKENFLDELEVQTKESLSFVKFLFDGMVEDLEITANTLQEYDDIWHPEAKEKLDLSHHLNFCDTTFVSDTEGNAYDHNGFEFSIADKAFF